MKQEGIIKQKKNKSRLFGWIALGVFGLSAIAALFGLSSTMQEIREVSIAKTPDAILASAGVNEEELVSLPVVYYDQRADNCVNLYDTNLRHDLYKRQFEWTSCKYYNKNIEQGLVEFELDDEYLPVAVGGKLTPNKGIDFDRWFDAVDNKSASYNGVLGMNYSANGAEFSFESEDFYPLDEVEFSSGDFANKDKHNHLFTMSFAVPFTVLGTGEEEFVISADDDTFVFVGDKLVIDMGGVHRATTGRFVIRKNGEIYSGIGDETLGYSGVKTEVGNGSIVRIFHADRDSSESVFNLKFTGMNLSVTNAELAQGGGVQIAYDPSDPSYVAPLGETSVFRPDSTKGLVVMATIEGVVILVVSILAVSAARFMIKQKR